jgi:hypothetical protein
MFDAAEFPHSSPHTDPGSPPGSVYVSGLVKARSTSKGDTLTAMLATMPPTVGTTVVFLMPRGRSPTRSVHTSGVLMKRKALKLAVGVSILAFTMMVAPAAAFAGTSPGMGHQGWRGDN